MIEKELIRIKEDLDTVSKEIDRNKGKKQQLIKQLKSLGISTIKEAEKELENLKDKINNQEKKLSLKLARFQGKYNI